MLGCKPRERSGGVEASELQAYFYCGTLPAESRTVRTLQRKILPAELKSSRLFSSKFWKPHDYCFKKRGKRDVCETLELKQDGSTSCVAVDGLAV